jgi:malate/lactate dehydrogenase
MPRKISVIADGEHGAVVTLLLAERDYADLVLLGAAGAEDIAAAWGSERVGHATDLEDTGGADLLVLAAESDAQTLRDLMSRSPGAIVIVAAAPVTAGCDLVLGAVSPPRGRVLGVAADGPYSLAVGARRLVDAVLLGRRGTLTCVARCQGEHGLHGTLAVRARVGEAGVEEILGDAAVSAPPAP